MPKRKQRKPHESPAFGSSVWSPLEDGCRASSIILFRDCREQFRLRFIEGWRTRALREAPESGHTGHWVLSNTYGRSRQPPGRRRVETLVDGYWDFRTKQLGRLAEKQQAIATKIKGTIAPLMAAYFKRWAGDFPGQKCPLRSRTVQPVKWLGTEQKFRTKLDVYGHDIPICGIFDGVFESKRNDIYLLETKFRSRIDSSAIMDGLQFDFQTMLYLWAIKQVYGRFPKGVLYNLVRRPGLRQGKNESPSDLLGRLEDELSFNPSDPRADHYFQRFEMVVLQKEIMDWGRQQLVPIVSDICCWWSGDSPHYMNDAMLIGKYGRCDAYGLITAGDETDMYRAEPEEAVLSAI